MKRLTNLLLATAMALPAATAFAQDATDHIVRIERYGYYPAKIYVQVGDTITFENHAPNSSYLFTIGYDDDYSSYDENDPCDLLDPDGDNQTEFGGSKDGFRVIWTSVGSSRTVDVTQCIETQFYSPYISGYNTDWNVRHDLIVFGEAPNG